MKIGSGNPKAFTLIELLVIIAIIAVLAGLLLPAVSSAKQRGYSAVCQSNERQMGVAMRMYLEEFHAFPMRAYRRIDPNPPYAWFHALSPYLANAKWGEGVFKCPAYKWEAKAPVAQTEITVGSYAYNAYGEGYDVDQQHTRGLGYTLEDTVPFRIPIEESIVAVPADMYAIGDSQVLYNISGGTGGPITYLGPNGFSALKIRTIVQHGRSYNMLFVDGHVQKVRAEKLYSREAIYVRRWNTYHWALGDPW